MSTNFKKSWSFWGAHKRFDHQFNNSFDDNFESPRIQIEDRFENLAYERNQFQTRSLRYGRCNILPKSDYQCFNSSMNNELDYKRNAHVQWSKNIQKNLGFQTLVSPHHNKFRAQELPQSSNQEQLQTPLLNTPTTAKINRKMQDVQDKCDEPIYENVQSIRLERPALLPTPMDSPNIRTVRFSSEEEMDMTPELPPRNPQHMQEVGQTTEQKGHNGGARLNKAFKGVCTSMRTFSQRFRKKTKRHYPIDSSPSTPMMTPDKNFFPFDLNTPITPHSYKRGTKRLQGSARRQLIGKENYGICRTPKHLYNTRANWTKFSPMPLYDGRYHPN